MTTLVRKKTVNELNAIWFSNSKTAVQKVSNSSSTSNMPAHVTEIVSQFKQIILKKPITRKLAFIRRFKN